MEFHVMYCPHIRRSNVASLKKISVTQHFYIGVYLLLLLFFKLNKILSNRPNSLVLKTLIFISWIHLYPKFSYRNQTTVITFLNPL